MSETEPLTRRSPVAAADAPVAAPFGRRFGARDNDIVAGFLMWRVWLRWAWNDVAQRYRRSTLGPFWNTLNMTVTLVGIGVVFSALWKIDIAVLMPYLCPGLILWMLLSTLVNEGCGLFAANAHVIKSINLPLSLHVYRGVTRNFIITAHSLIIQAIVMVAFSVPLTGDTLLVVPAVVIYALNGTWVMLLLGVVCARYRDIPQVIANLIQLLFFVTPVFWFPHSLGRADFLAHYNVLLHFIDIARLPLMGTEPLTVSWIVVGGVTVAGWAVTVPLYHRYHKRMVKWL